MSEDEKTEQPTRNPFCMGDWVNLSPTGSDQGVCMVRRSEIEAVTRKQTHLWDGSNRIVAEMVTVQMKSGSVQNVNFRGPTAAVDADALRDACMRRFTPPPETYTFSRLITLEQIAKHILGDNVAERIGLPWPKQVAERMLAANRIMVTINPS